MGLGGTLYFWYFTGITKVCRGLGSGGGGGEWGEVRVRGRGRRYTQPHSKHSKHSSHIWNSLRFFNFLKICDVGAGRGCFIR